ncbi:MAG: DEAD/DEAH box helicase family protein [Candidatus Levybacteria bacterium]|nr:DEAD/DEAH box helicase family protein [Candidatus Levybacteria bacterium]
MKLTLDKITKELNLRKPQEQSLVKLDALMSSFKIGDDPKDIEAKLIGSLKFDTEFPSFTFALATGVGKTRLMAAMIAYLYLNKGLKDFFILTPGETIYTKTIDNFTPGSKKYVFEGLTDLPMFNLVTGENYAYSDFGNQLFDAINIYVFNIQKIFNERKDVEFKFHKYQETLGSSFAELLQKKDLVILMDESHRYRGEKSLRAINNLKPELGLEFTATPTSPNVVYTYSLADAIKDSKTALENLSRGGDASSGYIKIPGVITRRDDFTYEGDIDQLKLEDGIRLHREKRALIEEYCKNNKLPMILPITLITTRSIEHANEVKALVTSDSFFGGDYKNKALVVTSESEVDSINQLLHLEDPPPFNKNEIVIHVDKLKEGWDVRNVFTIIPFRASISKTLIEQTIGRGLRLPFGVLTGVQELDTLDIVSHDNYARVLAVAHEVAEGILVTEAKQREEMRVETINPSENKDLWIKLPVVETKVHSSNKLEFFPIEMKLEELKQIKAKIVRADIVTQQTEEIEAELEIKEEIDPVNRFVRLIIKEISEIDVTFKEVLQKLVKHYLDQLGVDRKTLSELVKQHEQTILNDMLPQIRSKLSEDTKIEFKVLDTELGYEPYSKAVKVSSVILNKNDASEAEARSNLIDGYVKSVYSTYTFDSAQEKLLADSLDNDISVKAWVRLRLGQLPIKYLYGSNYNPDFVVEREEGYYLVEVKDKSKIDKKDPEVFSKAAKAEEWCEVATKATKKKWIYKLIPHDAIDRINAFDAIISSAQKLN